MNRLFTTLLLTALFTSAHAGMEMNDNPVTTLVYVQQFEYRDGIGGNNGEGGLVWDDARLRIGTDLNKIELRSSGERADNETESANVQLFYSRALWSFWDFQIGWTRDIRPKPQRDWLTFGFTGIAPYEMHGDVFLSVGRNGRTALELEFEKDFLITQRWIIAPLIEADFSSKDDPEVGIGSGLTELELGLRLRYRISKKIAPYAGISWRGLYGDTADFAEAEGEDPKVWQWVVGFTGWF